MTMHVVRIPRHRVGVLIGPGGKVKRELEGRSGATIEVDSKAGEVMIDDENVFEPILSLKTRDVVRAIGRGLSSENAFRLFQDDTYLEVIDLTDYVGKEAKRLERVRSRLIGSGGKARRTVEEATGVNVAIMGKTVSILGDVQEVAVARDAVEMIVNGAAHATVYRFLERKKKELRLQDIGL